MIRDREIKVEEKYFRFSTKRVSWDGNSNSYLHMFSDVTNMKFVEEQR